jgi:hypothetical protein
VSSPLSLYHFSQPHDLDPKTGNTSLNEGVSANWNQPRNA